MKDHVMGFQNNFREKQESSFGIENALAGYCRRRWPDKPLQHIAREWDLTESEASNVLYALASKRVLNKVLRHRRGGPYLFFHLAADVVGATVEDVIQQQAGEIEDAANKQALAAIRLSKMASRLADFSGDLGRDRDGLGPDHP